MTPWTRTSRAVRGDGGAPAWAPVFAQGLRAFLEKNGIELDPRLLSDGLETTSTQSVRKLFSKKELRVRTASFLLPGALLHLVADGDEPASVMRLPFARLTVSDYATGPLAKMQPDHGFTLHGVVTMGGTVGDLFVGHDGGAIATAFQSRLEATLG